MASLPVELTSFVGRDAELVQARDAVASSRLVTFIGAGGSGKTRLARELASGLESEYRNGVRYVELAALTDPASIAQAIVQAAGIVESAGRTPEDSLLAAFRDSETLLLLDNCEHLIEECASLTERLLKECSGLRVLATSRQPLEIPGEVSFLVPSMTLPPVDGSISDLVKSEATQLFAERAAAAKPGFVVDEMNAKSVADICRRLDGLPLAIELAAARIRSMSPAEILERLDDRLSVLGRAATGDPRHRTLRATIDWSYQLLTDPERILFRRLSVFLGGWRLEDAEAVCADEMLPIRSIADIHSRLVDRSLIVVETGEGGRSRYGFLETLRQYAAESLAELGEQGALRAGHFAHFLDLAVAYDSKRMTEGSDAGLSALTDHRDNFRAALVWGEANDPARALRLTSALDDFWRMLTATEGWHWLQRTLPSTIGDEPSRVRALLSAGMLSAYVPAYSEGIGLLRQAAASAQRLGDRASGGWADLWLGRLLLFRDDIAAAKEHLMRALAIHEQLDLPLGRVRALALLGLIEGLIQGQLGEAEQRLETAVSLAHAIGDSWGEGYAHVMLGLTAGHSGDLERSADHCRAALRMPSLGPILGVPLQGMAKAIVENDPARAMQVLGAADSHFERTSTLEPPFAQRQAQATRLRAEELLGSDAAAASLARGRRLTTEEAVDLAVSDPRQTNLVTSPLSAREKQVAALVSRGLTNREIAASLFISIRTAESHVDHILTKLDLANRAQLAAWAISSELTASS